MRTPYELLPSPRHHTWTPGTIYCFGNRPGTFPPKKIKVVIYKNSMCSRMPKKVERKIQPLYVELSQSTRIQGFRNGNKLAVLFLGAVITVTPTAHFRTPTSQKILELSNVSKGVVKVSSWIRERERCRPLLEHPHWSFLMRVPSSLHTHPIQISLFKVSTASAPTFFIKLNHIENIVSSCLGRFSRRSTRKILDLMRYQQRRLRGRREGFCANV